MKVMVILVYDREGVTLSHIFPPSHIAYRISFNAQYCCSVLEHHLRPVLRKKRRHILQNTLNILHDNVGPHATRAGLISSVVETEK